MAQLLRALLRTEDPAAPPPLSEVSDVENVDVDGLLGLALRILSGLPPRRLRSKKKAELSGYLFAEAPLLVHEVAAGLRRFRRCFPELSRETVDPAELEAGLRRASRWQSLREFAALLLQIADEQHSLELSRQVRTALSVLRHVRADRLRLPTTSRAGAPGPADAVAEDRAFAMAAAFATLRARSRWGKKSTRRPR